MLSKLSKYLFKSNEMRSIYKTISQLHKKYSSKLLLMKTKSRDIEMIYI